MNTILNFISKIFTLQFRNKTLEPILRKSMQLLDSQTLDEIYSRTHGFITNEGSFSDRAGKSDLYYTLFGLLVSDAIMPGKNNESLKNYLRKLHLSSDYKGVYLYCAAIIHYKLFGDDVEAKKLRNKVTDSLKQNLQKPDYNLFLGILCLYVHHDYFSIFKILRKMEVEENENDLPCPVLAAKAIMLTASGKEITKTVQNLMLFYRGNGNFGALKNSPTGDLLSTAVALFALQFIGADLRLIKPDCLVYIDSLYENGSFRATELDFETDIEYTFYGMLALGSLV